MDLGISVRQVVEAKFSPYLDSLPEGIREEKLQSYIESSKDSLQGTINEAQSIVNSVESTCANIVNSVPMTIAQVASLVTMIDPTAKAAQLTTIIESVSSSKDQLNRASSQVESLSNILIQLSMSSSIVDTLKTALSSAMALLNTIPV